jgi:hypothetical protein
MFSTGSDERGSAMKIISSLLLIIAMLSSSYAYARQVGEVKYARGAVTVQKEDGSGARLVGKGDQLIQGEVIKTGPKSFAVINLADETKMTLRPGTSFAVENMDAQQTSKATALLKLFRGGFRAITGYISKKNPKGYRIKTPAVTIGIRGTEFDARLCGTDCANENKKLEKKLKEKQTKVIGRVAYKRGDIKALNFAEKTRQLETSSNLYEGDTLTTGDNSYAVIVFRDKSRISLQANTGFRIDELRYDVEQPSGSSALFSLLRGGLRAVTGLVGKLRPKGYRMRTRFTTIGIRGTGYDLLCTGSCGEGTPSNIDLPKGDGLYANVWEGTITLDDRTLDVGQAAFIKSATAAPVLLPKVPDFFKTNPVPKPDEVKVEDMEFTEAAAQDAPPGLYVSVIEGEVDIKSDTTNEVIRITQGEAAFADATGQQVKLLPAVPTFQKYDPYPTPDKVDAGAVLINTDGLGDEEGLVCEVQ